MNRTNIYLSDEQRDRLDALARATGRSRAEVIRQALDRALDEGQPDMLDADLAAIESSFGVLDEQIVLDRSEGARAAHLERIAGL